MKDANTHPAAVAERPWYEMESVDLLVEGTNCTSGLPIDGGERTLQVIQITETGIWLEMPSQSCAVGHLLELRIYVQHRKHRPELTEIEPMAVTGVVDSVLVNDKDQMCVEVSFRQFAPERWEALLGKVVDQQASINRLLERTRR